MSLLKYSNRALNPAINTLYLDGVTADVRFIFKTKNDQFDTVPAHKPLLMAVSKVFRAMFNGSWKEKDCVQIVDTTAVAFKDFLQFFYFTEVAVKMSTVAAVMNLGQKYFVADCVSACSRFLSDNLTNDNACWVYALAVICNRDELKKLCEVTIGINTSTVLKTSSFIRSDQKIMARILKLDSLTCVETELFEAALAWVKATAKQDQLNSDVILAHLGDSFYDIRYELMPMQEFTTIFSSYETLFTADQRRSIIQSIASKEFETKTEVNIGRESAWYKLPFIICERNSNISNQPYEIADMEVETFSTNKPLLLRGIICAEIYYFDDYFSPIMDDIPGQIKIFEFRATTNDAKVGLRTIYEDDDIELEYDDNEYNLWLNKPVIIKPGKKYQIQLTLDMEDEFSTNIKMKGHQVASNGFVITFHTAQERGLISGLKFNPY
ncbi:BTB/POZ domain-containing protein 6-like [Sitodiplosis mosellana]|uniref:BTB/POZ domain-containing protein 6-like n=1 Tax=Sitodiplosis mosellana TaxID=263140 RepID=UPI00244474F0|nr:BTB/POZ domain-containing protein 6-like [Sitodiplosis mosellana]